MHDSTRLAETRLFTKQPKMNKKGNASTWLVTASFYVFVDAALLAEVVKEGILYTQKHLRKIFLLFVSVTTDQRLHCKPDCCRKSVVSIPLMKRAIFKCVTTQQQHTCIYIPLPLLPLLLTELHRKIVERNQHP